MRRSSARRRRSWRGPRHRALRAARGVRASRAGRRGRRGAPGAPRTSARTSAVALAAAASAERGVQLVDGAVGLDAQVVLGDALAAEEIGLAGVAAPGVDLHGALPLAPPQERPRAARRRPRGTRRARRRRRGRSPSATGRLPELVAEAAQQLRFDLLAGRARPRLLEDPEPQLVGLGARAVGEGAAGAVGAHQAVGEVVGPLPRRRRRRPRDRRGRARGAAARRRASPQRSQSRQSWRVRSARWRISWRGGSATTREPGGTDSVT